MCSVVVLAVLVVVLEDLDRAPDVALLRAETVAGGPRPTEVGEDEEAISAGRLMLKKLFMLAIVALGIGMAVPSTRAVLSEKAKPLMDGFKAKIVPSRLEAMASQLTARVNRGEGLPANFEGWLERDFSSSAQDPWGNLYYFESRRGGFLVGSLGPDGRRGTEDDITREQRLQ